MATTKIHPIKINIHAVSKYIQDPLKTENGDLVSAFMCDENEVQKSFENVLNNERSTHRKVIARHIIQSFKPGEVETDMAHQIGLQLADKHLQGKYQYVLATHVDKGHIHNHILFNNVSFIDYKSYNSNKKSYHNIREISDSLCLEYGLNVIENAEKNKQFEDPHQSKGKYKNTFRYQLRKDIDFALKKSINLDEFKEIMSENYDIKEGKHLAFKHKNNGQQRFIRCRSLGYRYQESMLQLRIDTEFLDAKDIEEKPIPERYIKRVIDLSKNDKFKENPGLQYWGINHNNLAISQTIYRLHQLGIGSFKQLENYIDRTTLSLEKDKKELVKLEKEMIEIIELKEILIKLKDNKSDNEVLLTTIDDLTSNKPNIILEELAVLIHCSPSEVIDEPINIDFHYNQLARHIAKLKDDIYKKNRNLINYKRLSINYKNFLIEKEVQQDEHTIK